MRALATRLGVVPAALYRHVRNKEQLHDLVLDGVLAEVDYQVDQLLAWTEQVKTLAHRLRTVLERPSRHRRAAQDPRPPRTTLLALAEAFLAPLHAAGLSAQQTGLAFSLLYDYILGFAVSTPTSINEQRIRDAATRSKLHTFFRSLPADRFPTLIALGEHVWVDNRDERFTAGLDTVIDGTQQGEKGSSSTAPARGRSQHPRR